jgi:hypothetical protein
VVSYRYYYFVPQLSGLAYGQALPMSSKAFRKKAASMMDGQDAALLEKVNLDFGPGEKSGCGFIDGLREWETALRLNLARLRAAKAGRDPDLQPAAPGFPQSAVKAAARAVEADNPIEGEIIIDKARWEAVQEIQGSELFHRNTVFAHLMKLMILERQASFQAETGFSQYKSLYDSILEQYGASADGVSADGASPMGESK